MPSVPMYTPFVEPYSDDSALYIALELMVNPFDLLPIKPLVAVILPVISTPSFVALNTCCPLLDSIKPSAVSDQPKLLLSPPFCVTLAAISDACS